MAEKPKKKFVRLTPMDDPAAFGPRLRAAREEAGMSLRDLSFPGCSPSYISRLENGGRMPSLQLINQLAKRLNIRPQDLTGITPEETEENFWATAAKVTDKMEPRRLRYLFGQNVPSDYFERVAWVARGLTQWPRQKRLALLAEFLSADPPGPE